jgi:predicted nuclease of predicted toxin-antitoxin system
LRFLLDNNITYGLRDDLKSQGHDLVTLKELHLQHLENGAVIQKGSELKRIIITFDKGLPLLGRLGQPSVILIDIHPNLDENVIPKITNLLAGIKQEHLDNHLIVFQAEDVAISKFKS